jgi:hypothetical protein
LHGWLFDFDLRGVRGWYWNTRFLLCQQSGKIFGSTLSAALGWLAWAFCLHPGFLSSQIIW